MKALNIKQKGWLFKLATFGGMSDDASVIDWPTRKANKLLKKMYNEDVIGSDEYYSRLKQESRDINFCEFSRKVVYGLLLLTFFAFVASAVAFVITFGTAAVIMALLGHAALFKIHFWNMCLVLGTIEWSIVGIILFSFCAWWLIKEGIPNWINKHTRTLSDEEQKAKLARYGDKLKAKLAKRELRSAFWAAIHNKTCFKVDFD
jgi:membrane protein implicated in regulation of membrane protease activity